MYLHFSYTLFCNKSPKSKWSTAVTGVQGVCVTPGALEACLLQPLTGPKVALIATDSYSWPAVVPCMAGSSQGKLGPHSTKNSRSSRLNSPSPCHLTALCCWNKVTATIWLKMMKIRSGVALQQETGSCLGDTSGCCFQRLFATTVSKFIYKIRNLCVGSFTSISFHSKLLASQVVLRCGHICKRLSPITSREEI